MALIDWPELALWLTRRASGDYMLTRLPPRITRRLGSHDLDVYETEGEPIGVRHLCADGIRAAGWDLPPLQPTRVWFMLAPLSWGRGHTMKVSFKLEGPVGEGGAQDEMMAFDLRYKHLRPSGLMEIASACLAMRQFIHTYDGDASGDDPAYTVTFGYQADAGAAPKLPGWEELFSGDVTCDELLYSQACQMQNAGLALLQKLMSTAEMEIKSGMRK